MFSSKRAALRVSGVAFLVLAMCFAFALGLSACTTEGDDDSDGGGTAATETTVMETTTTEEVTTTTVPEGIDPELLGSWYSAELDETVTYTIEGTLIVTYGKTVTPDGQEASDTHSYTADGTTTVNAAGEPGAYSIDGDVLTIADPEYGQVSYTRIGE